MDCIIGHSGFVGGHLIRQHDFMGRFNTRNIKSAAGQSFETVVCAAAPGSMMEANRAPERDRDRIDALIGQLAEIHADRMILISSIAVLAEFAGQDDESSEAFQQTIAYGHHRRVLEKFCADHFAECLIVRLPALFGAGLRKNFIFDLLNPVPSMLTEEKREAVQAMVPKGSADTVSKVFDLDSETGLCKLDRERLAADPGRRALEQALLEADMSSTQFHNPDTSYQYYDMTRLWADIGISRAAELNVIHLATEPLRAGDIHLELTGRTMPETGARLHREDMRTRHADLWSRQGPYLDDKGNVLRQLKSFYSAEKNH